jgi:hypothetical protein
MLELQCPHCNGMVIIEQLNCAIFRHGVFKNTGKQIPPHASKEECDNWVKNNDIYGCGKPFQVIENKPVICEYI